MSEAARRETTSRTSVHRSGHPRGWLIGFFTSHAWTKIISLGLGVLVWQLIDRQLVGELLPATTLQLVSEVEEDPAGALLYEVPANWVVLDVSPREIDVRILGRNVEKDLLPRPLRAVVTEDRLDLADGQNLTRVVLAPEDVSLAGMTETEVQFSEPVTITLSPLEERYFQLELVGDAARKGWKAQFEPYSVPVRGPLSRFKLIPQSRWVVPVDIDADRLAGRRQTTLSAATLQNALSQRFTEKPPFEIASRARIRVTLEPPPEELESLQLGDVPVIVTEVDTGLIELKPEPKRMTTVTVRGPRAVIAALKQDKDARARLAGALRVVAELDDPLERHFEANRDNPTASTTLSPISIESLFVVPASIEAARALEAEYGTLQIEDPTKIFIHARLKPIKEGD